MTYVVSDIHGQYDKYTALLEKINFSDNDTLYVLGDIIDRNNGGIKIMLDMISRPNVVMLMGNHEAMMLDTLLEFTQISVDAISALSAWFLNGGEPTFNEYMEIGSKERIAVLGALEKMPYFAEISINDNDFVLLHGGFEDFSSERPLSDYSRDEIVWAEPDFENGYFENKFTIVGHTPTPTVCGEPKIFRAGKLIDIDCGCAYVDGKLGCLCLDNFEEFYV